MSDHPQAPSLPSPNYYSIMSDDASSVDSVTGGPPPPTAGVPSRMRPPPAPNEQRIPLARQAKLSSTASRNPPGGRTGRRESGGASNVGGRLSTRPSLLRTPTPLRTGLPISTGPPPEPPPESQISESLLSDDDAFGSQQTDAGFDESQVGVTGVFTRMNRQLDVQFTTMRELLQENLTEALGAMTAAFTMSLTAHTQQLTSTLTDLGTRINEHQSTLSNLQLEVGQHSTGLNESIAAIVQLNKDLKERAMAAPTLQENVIPHEPPQPAASTSSNRPATPVDPDVTEPLDNAGDATRVDVTANSALAHLVRDDSQTGDWVTRWKDTVGSNRPPRRVMKTYVDHLDISVDDLDDLLCWDCWPDDDTHADDVEDGLADSA